MLIPNQMIEVRWRKNTKKRYESLGYVFTKYDDVFYVKPEDLSKGSEQKVKVQCDGCLEIKTIKYSDYLATTHNGKDYCKKCNRIIGDKTCIERYGVDNPSKVAKFMDKKNKTCMERYGEKTPLKSKEIQEKIKESNLKHYGVDNPLKSQEVWESIKQTNLNKYGCQYVVQCPEVSRKIKQHAMETLTKNGKVPTSSQQIATYNILKDMYNICELNYSYGTYSLDCYVKTNNVEIDVEYDGWYWHQDKEKDNKRDKFMNSQGLKVLRIKGGKEIPTKEQLIEAIDYLVEGNHGYVEIQLDI